MFNGVYNVIDHVEPLMSSTAQELPEKKFRDVEVQTDPIDLSKIIKSKENLLSCTIDLQVEEIYRSDLSKPNTNGNQEIVPAKIQDQPIEGNKWKTMVDQSEQQNVKDSWDTRPSGSSSANDWTQQ